MEKSKLRATYFVIVVSVIVIFAFICIYYYQDSIKSELFWLVLGLLIFLIYLYLMFYPDVKRILKFKPENNLFPSNDNLLLEKALSGKNPQQLWELALEYEGKWLLDPYLKALRAVVDLDPGGEYGKKAAFKLKHYDEAKPFDDGVLKKIQSASEKITKSSHDYQAWFELGNAHAEGGLKDDAKNIYRRILELSSDIELKEKVRQRLKELDTLRD